MLTNKDQSMLSRIEKKSKMLRLNSGGRLIVFVAIDYFLALSIFISFIGEAFEITINNRTKSYQDHCGTDYLYRLIFLVFFVKMF